MKRLQRAACSLAPACLGVGHQLSSGACVPIPPQGTTTTVVPTAWFRQGRPFLSGRFRLQVDREDFQRVCPQEGSSAP